ncbi:hypothetical protein BP00DRAFT_428019 [Aspergillus indologenus CBS 114.80]|uniref:FUN14-domain-containing protein n=1 Tax=Aspergillus indologenus CBS 114.80 TaxID=1450541 RepID=A0A2V5J4H4_9EURO|nr:hypothetical protein BP00DRAFT_428019 [Aspergillus indologenus CBS 114.80]
MTFLLSRTTTTLLGTTLGLGLTASLHPLSPFRAAPLQCQYSAAAGAPEPNWTVPASDPAIRKPGRTGPILTAANMRQVSLGSVLGLVVGVGLRAFSRVLVVLIGMGIVAVEWAAAKGYNILPVNTLQRYVKRVDLQGAVSKHIPFKLSFGVTMGLAALAQF